MRLIEADAVYKILESCEIEKATIGNPLTDWEYGYNCGIERAESEIECAPTIDAIPVEWINKYTNEHRTYMHAFSEMVACWYDEKEKREYEMASDMRDYCEKYEPTYNPEDGSL